MYDYSYFAERYGVDGCDGVIDSFGGVVDLWVVADLAANWMISDCGYCGGGDVTYDGDVNEDDLVKVGEQWLCSAPANWGRADMDGDGVVGLADFEIFSLWWLN